MTTSNESLTVWYQLADEEWGEDTDGAFAVSLPPNSMIFQLCNAIVAQEQPKLEKADASSLKVYATCDGFESGEEEPLKKSSPVPSQTTEENPLYVIVPYWLLPNAVSPTENSIAWGNLMLARAAGPPPNSDDE